MLQQNNSRPARQNRSALKSSAPPKQVPLHPASSANPTQPPPASQPITGFLEVAAFSTIDSQFHVSISLRTHHTTTKIISVDIYFRGAIFLHLPLHKSALINPLRPRMSPSHLPGENGQDTSLVLQKQEMCLTRKHLDILQYAAKTTRPAPRSIPVPAKCCCCLMRGAKVVSYMHVTIRRPGKIDQSTRSLPTQLSTRRRITPWRQVQPSQARTSLLHTGRETTETI